MGSHTPPGPRSSAPVIEHRPRGRDAGRVLVLNATYEPINVCTVRRAAVLILKNRAEVLEKGDWALHAENLTRIESRPRKGPLGHYVFHLDMEGRADDRPVAEAIEGLGAQCEQVRLLGSYPAA